jgi:hypothetical protein
LSDASVGFHAQQAGYGLGIHRLAGNLEHLDQFYDPRFKDHVNTMEFSGSREFVAPQLSIAAGYNPVYVHQVGPEQELLRLL